MKLKKTLAVLLTLAILLALCACGGSDTPAAVETKDTPAPEIITHPGDETASGGDGGTVELTVFAAASMTETLEEIAELFKDVAPDVELTFNFDSASALSAQIEEGADVDIFISDDQTQMDRLDVRAAAEVNTDGLDLVLSDSRIDLLENKLALVVPEGNPKDIPSLTDMVLGVAGGSISAAIGSEDVPVGQYARRIFTFYAVNEDTLAAAGSLTYGSNVKEVVAQVSDAAVDCGVVYQTDAHAAGLEVVETAGEEMCGRIIYPAAVMKVSKNAEAAQEFLDYLISAEAIAVFEAAGFAIVR